MTDIASRISRTSSHAFFEGERLRYILPADTIFHYNAEDSGFSLTLIRLGHKVAGTSHVAIIGGAHRSLAQCTESLCSALIEAGAEPQDLAGVLLGAALAERDDFGSSRAIRFVADCYPSAVQAAQNHFQIILPMDASEAPEGFPLVVEDIAANE